MSLNVEIKYNDFGDDDLFCTFSKERINPNEKFAYLLIQNYDGSVDKLPYKLENLPESEEYDDEI